MARTTRRRYLRQSVSGLTAAACSLPKTAPALDEGVTTTSTLTSEQAGSLAQMAADVMQALDIPALSLAFAKGGRVLHATAFGLADKERQERATPDHLFRIASVSKPLTSVAMHRLMENVGLPRHQRVFGPGNVLQDYRLPAAQAARLEAVTLDHLLTHTAGGWGNQKNDPMFRHKEMGHQELIQTTLDEAPLENEPGKAYAYSNFGYCLLGRVLEKQVGVSYTDLMRDLIFTPCGMSSTRLAGNALADRVAKEVVYYPQGTENAYGMNVARMDAHGGWLSTPTDLVNFLMRVDGFDTPPDLLRPETLKAMTTPTAANAGYASGWAVNKVPNWWHGGSLPGTSTLAVRTASGLCWAVFANTRRRNREDPAKDTSPALDRLMWRMARSIPEWQA